MTSPDGHQIQTVRPMGGPMGSALALGTSAQRCESLIDALLSNMDQGEGWTWSDAEGRWWLWGRNATLFRYSTDGESGVCLVDTIVVEEVQDHGQAVCLLNELNVHSAGWFWWLDRERNQIMASMRYAVVPKDWWWSLLLLELVPLYVTSIDSMGPLLSTSCAGRLAVSAHPNRGERPSRDGWIIGCRLGSREPTASLGIALLPHEFGQLDTAIHLLSSDLQVADEPLKLEFFDPLDLVLHDDEQRPTVVLRQGWHPEIGWGAQTATVPGIFAPESDDLGPLFVLASTLNEEFGKYDDSLAVVAGSWIVTEGLGLVHQSYIPGVQVEKVLGEARGTAGNVLALMAQPSDRLNDAHGLRGLAAQNDFDVRSIESGEILEALSSVWFIGPVGMSYLADQQSNDLEPEEELWMVPKHVPVCSFGIFNPYGPTVSSLEIGYELDDAHDLVMSLYFVLRHPSVPTIEYLGDARSEEDMAQLIMSSLSKVEGGILGSGPEWMNVFAERYGEVVNQGLRWWASASGNDLDAVAEGTELLDCALNPWARMGPNRPPADPPPESASDPLGYWIDALTDRIVILGEQLYIRSAWEGAIATLADPEDPDKAQRATNFFLDRIDQRLAASRPDIDSA